MLLGGAVFNAVNLALGGDYAGFADQAHFGWVTTEWRAVVAPNQLLFIGLLGRRTRDNTPRTREELARGSAPFEKAAATMARPVLYTDEPAALDSRGQTRRNPSEVAVPGDRRRGPGRSCAASPGGSATGRCIR